MRTLSVLLAIAMIVGAWYYPQLPDTVASHFSASGEADGWMSRGGFIIFYAALMVFLYGTFVGTGYLMRVLPDSYINVPNKNYWLAPVRREESKRFLEKII